MVQGAGVPGVVSKAAQLVSVVRLGREAPGEEKPGDRVVLVARRQVAVKLFKVREGPTQWESKSCIKSLIERPKRNSWYK